jgi:hypothetical protein
MEELANKLQLEKFFTDNEAGDYLGIPYKGSVCINLRRALKKLDFNPGSGNVFDEELENAVLEFQKAYNHNNKDGFFGQGTRKLLAEVLMKEYGSSIISEFTDFKKNNPLTLFISYAWQDKDTVNKIDQWLRDNGIKVRRDIYDFIPGKQLPEEIEKTIVESDKVLAVYSISSKDRDWPRFEISVAEKVEKDKRGHFIIYLILDDASLPKHDVNRIAITAKGKKLRVIGEQIIKGMNNNSSEPPRYDYNDDEVLV